MLCLRRVRPSAVLGSTLKTDAPTTARRSTSSPLKCDAAGSTTPAKIATKRWPATAEVWPPDEWDQPAVRCGTCRKKLTTAEYFDCANECPGESAPPHEESIGRSSGKCRSTISMSSANT